MKVSNDSVAELPKEAQTLGYSALNQNEIWHISDRVLCIQSNPEINKTYIKELIINKLYDVGKLDDNEKNKALDGLDEVMIPISRHFILKCIFNFMKIPNAHLKRLIEQESFELDQ